MNTRKRRGRGRMPKDRYPPFRPSEEIVALWMLLEPKNFRATIENYVGKPPKGFRIKEARKLADLAKNPLLRDFLEKQYPHGGSSPVDWQPPALSSESTKESQKFSLLSEQQIRAAKNASHLDDLFPEEKMSYQGARPLQEIPNGTNLQNTDKRASSIADISKTLGNIIEGSKPDFTAIMLDIKNDNSKALYEHLSNGLDVNTILPAVPRRRKEKGKSETRPLTLLECAVFETAFSCVTLLISDAKLDYNLRANKDYPSPAARAFINSSKSADSLKIGKMLYERNSNVGGQGSECLLSYIFFHCTFAMEFSGKVQLDIVNYLVKKGCRLDQAGIWKIYEWLEKTSTMTDYIDSLIAIINGNRFLFYEQIKARELCSTVSFFDSYATMTCAEQKHNTFRIISAILLVDTCHSYDNFFAISRLNLVEFLPAIKEVLLADDCPLTADSLTGIFRSLVKDFRHPGSDPRVTSEKRKFAEALLDSGKLNLSLATRADNKNVFILNFAMRMREGDFDNFFEKIVQRGLKDDPDFVNTKVRDQNWLSGSINIMSRHYALSDIEAERLEYLFKNGYDFDLHAHPSTGDLPVHYLGAHGSTNTFHLLGEDRMKMKNKKGWTAAHFACHLGLVRSAAHLFRAYPSLMEIKNDDDKKPMDLVKAPHNVEIIKKMVSDGVPEYQKQYEELLARVKKATYQETPPKNLTPAVEDVLDKTKEEHPQSATPRASISFAPSFPALDKAEITAMAKKAVDEKGDSVEIETAEKTEKLVEKDQPKDVEASEPIDEASLRKTAENLCLKIITDVVDDFFAELKKKEAIEIQDQPEEEAQEEKQEDPSVIEKKDLKARQSTRTPDIKELCSFDNSEETEICVEVQKILADKPDMSVNEIKSPTDRRKPKVPRVDSGCGSPCIPSTVVTESESEEETALTDEETVESLCNDATAVDQGLATEKFDAQEETEAAVEPKNDQDVAQNAPVKENKPKEEKAEKLVEETRVLENMQSCENSAYASSIAGSDFRSSSNSIAATTSTISAPRSQTPSYMDRIYKMEIKNLQSDRLELAQENEVLRNELEETRLELEKYRLHFGTLPDTL